MLNMQENEVFVIDLTSANTSGEIINSISLALEIPSASGKKIFLKLKDTVLNQSQLLSIKSLISSYGSTLAKVETQSLITYGVCEGMNITVTKPLDYSSNAESSEDGEKSSGAGKVQTPSEFAAKKPEEILDMNSLEEVLEGDSKEEVMGGQISLIQDEKIEKTESEGMQDALAPMQDVKDFYKEHSSGIQLGFEEETVQEERQIEKPETVQEIASIQEEDRQETTQKEAEEEIQIPVSEAGQSSMLDVYSQDSIFEDVKVGEKQVIGVYKKAEDEEGEDAYEEVDFYAPPTDEPVVIDSKQTIYVTQTLRSGQTLEFDGNIVIVGDCHPGSEIKAAGDITVWGVLGSIAHAGIKGNRDAKIRALKMHAVQLRIANCYSRRPDGNNIPYIVKSHTFTPEEARIVDDGIVLFKI